MLAFLLTILLAFAYNPYVRTLRRAHQTGAAPASGAGQMNPYMYDMDFGDLYEDWLPMMSGAMSGAFGGMGAMGGGAAGGAANPLAAFTGVYMNNPYRMNMPKCMDNDACTAFVAHQMYSGINGGSGSGSTTGGAAAGTGAAAGGAAAGGADAGAAAGGAAAQSGAAGSSFTPAMFGFPPGFNPQFYGLDWDAQVIDCMDDSKCAHGLVSYSTGRNMGGAMRGIFSQMYMPSRLQRPRRLSRPRYGIPYRYGRQ